MSLKSAFTSIRPWQLAITSMRQADVVTIIAFTLFFTPLIFDVIVIITLIPIIHVHSSHFTMPLLTQWAVTIYNVHCGVIDIVNCDYHLVRSFQMTVRSIILLDFVENMPSFIVNRFVMQLLPYSTLEI